MKKPRRSRRPGLLVGLSERANLLRLWALLALGDLELNPLVLLQSAVAARLDRAEVHEHIGSATVHGDEAEALLGVEPFDGSLRHLSLLHEGVPAARAAGPYLAVFEQRRLLPITSSGAGAVHVHKNSAKNTRSPPPWGNPSLRGKIHESRG